MGHYAALRLVGDKAAVSAPILTLTAGLSRQPSASVSTIPAEVEIVAVVMIAVTVTVVGIFVVFVILDIVLVDDDAAIGATAGELADGCAAGTGCRVRVTRRDRTRRRCPDGRNEDEVALRIRRHRMGARGGRDRLDEDAGSIDHAEDGTCAGRRARR